MNRIYKKHVRKVSLDCIYPPIEESVYSHNKYYVVSLGRGKRKLFKNKSKAEAYLAMETKKINDHITLLNHLYADLYSDIRRKWLVLSEQNYRELIFEVTKAEPLFDYLFKRTYSPNYNYLIFTWLSAIINILTQATKKLVRILNQTKKKDDTLFHKYYLNELKNIQEDLQLK